MSTAQSKDPVRKWTFLAPVWNVKFGDDPQGELTIGQTRFIDSQRLQRVRRSVGLPKRLSQLKTTIGLTKDLFNESSTFAIVQMTDTRAEAEIKCLKEVDNATHVLASSQLSSFRSSSVSPARISGEGISPANIHGLFSSTNGAWSVRRYRTKLEVPLLINRLWRKTQSRHFLFKLLDVIHKTRSHTPSSWKGDLKRALILIGRSQNSKRVCDAFLLNMIAVETLLTRQGDRYLEMLPSRAMSLLAWVSKEGEEKVSDKIRHVYKLRCGYVHSGETSAIGISELLFTDDLLLNLLVNIAGHPKLFGSKDEIIKFAEKVKAEKTLGNKPKVRPKSLRRIARAYDETIFDEIRYS